MTGQTHVFNYLTNALQNHRLSPSLLFIGIDGIGKKTVAIELTQTLLCLHPISPKDLGQLGACHECEPCRKVFSFSHPDYLLINEETQAQYLREKTESQTAIKIESIRFLDKFLQIKPLEGQRRIVVVDHAHKMTLDAANALLKTLEEPPHNGQIVLLANDEKNLPSTILSRCTILKFHPISVQELANWLNKNHGVNAEEAIKIAERSGGSFSRASSLCQEDSAPDDIAELELDEFFEAVGSPSFRKDSRDRAQTLLRQLIESAQIKLEKGDLTQAKRLDILFRARKQLDHHVSPRLILENVFIKTKPGSSQRTAK